PGIVRRAPGPAWLARLPEAGPPQVTIRAIYPATGYIHAVLVGSRSSGPRVQRGGRRWQIGNFLLIDRCPEARDPLPASVGLGPVSWNPAPLGRRRTPE